MVGETYTDEIKNGAIATRGWRPVFRPAGPPDSTSGRARTGQTRPKDQVSSRK